MPSRRVFVSVVAVVAMVALVPGGGVFTQQQASTIMLTNDDGYDAAGLQALVKALAGLGELYVAAPSQNQSGAGHSITIADPIYVLERRQPEIVAGWAIDGRPATCARLALDSLLPRRPDLVVSGINRGENLGSAVYLSGTLGAAREAAFSAIPAIAVSMGGNDPADFARTARYVRQLVEDLRAKNLLQPGFFLNVNAPRGGWKGVRVTRLSVKPSRQIWDRRTHPRGRVYFWNDYEQVSDDAEDTDVGAFFRGYLTLTPMTLDVTQPKAMDGLRSLEAAAAKAAAN
jgi:5'-nucleotidase